nr:HNH endonuclease [Saccharibacillus deserti]
MGRKRNRPAKTKDNPDLAADSTSVSALDEPSAEAAPAAEMPRKRKRRRRRRSGAKAGTAASAESAAGSLNPSGETSSAAASEPGIPEPEIDAPETSAADTAPAAGRRKRRRGGAKKRKAARGTEISDAGTDAAETSASPEEAADELPVVTDSSADPAGDSPKPRKRRRKRRRAGAKKSAAAGTEFPVPGSGEAPPGAADPRGAGFSAEEPQRTGAADGPAEERPPVFVGGPGEDADPSDGVKVCLYCGEPKPLGDFLRRTGKRSGSEARRGACRDCRKRRRSAALEAGDAASDPMPPSAEARPHEALPAEVEAAESAPKRRVRRPPPEPPADAMLEPTREAELRPTRQGMIRMRGRTDKGRRWQQETDLEMARCLVREHAAVLVNRFTIRRLYTNRTFRRYILERDRYTCHFCGEYGDTIDHLLPRAKGGHTTPLNCVCACMLCNQNKADRDLDEFMEDAEPLDSFLSAGSRNDRSEEPFATRPL